jgi:hypothetical protein
MNNRLAFKAFIFGHLIVSACNAQSTNSTDAGEAKTLEKVEIVAQTNSGVFTYAKAYSLLSKLTELPSTSKIDLALYMRPSVDTRLKPTDVNLKIQGETYSSAVEIQADWRLVVPLSRRAFDEGADFVMNIDSNKFQREARIEIRNPKNTTTSLNYYFDALNEVVAAERKLFFRFAPLKSVIAYNFAASNSKVEIECDGQNVDALVPETKSRTIYLSLDPSWQRRSCNITFSPALPTYSVPVNGK